MRVIAINGSPNHKNGNTEMILSPFLDGMRENGADIEVFYTRKLNIGPCLADFHCWTPETWGKCSQKDDMRLLFPKLEKADVIVFATPVYFDGMTGPLKNLIDRMLLIGKPFLTIFNDHSRHDLVNEAQKGKIVLISTCGFWEMDNFDPLLAHVKAISLNVKRPLVGSLLRPHGPSMKILMEQGQSMDKVTESAKEAGRQLAKHGSIPDDVLLGVQQELMPREAYINIFREPN